jgi:hypothetical protein
LTAASAIQIPTAWASLTPDGQDEWLILRYRKAVVPVAVSIHETFNPGAVNRVSAFTHDGREVTLWKGQDPTPPDRDRGISNIPLKRSFKTDRIKVYVNSREIPGWNEIDAAGLIDASGETQWAVEAWVSSTYAAHIGPEPVSNDRILRQLQAEVRQLKARVKALEEALAKKESRRAAR